MKHKILIIILAVAIFIPSVVAIVNYSSQQGGDANSHNTVSVTLTDTAQNTYVFQRAVSGTRDFMDFILKMNADAIKIGELPTTVNMDSFYTASVKTAVTELDYKYYLTKSSADCYFTDSAGDAYKISEEDARHFINSSYAAALYDNGTPAVLTVLQETMAPDSSQWHFKNTAGDFVDADTTFTVKDETEEWEFEGGLKAISFSIQPDSLRAKITGSDGQVLFDDLFDNVSNFTYENDSKVNVELEAKWFEDSKRDYYGEQTYKFAATLRAPAEFMAGATSLEIGSFICVTGKNVKNPEAVTFASEPSINYTPTFFADGEYVQALVPFGCDLSAGTYALSFTYGGVTQKIEISLTARANPFRDKTLNINQTVVQASGSDEAIQKAKDALLPIAQTASATRMWDGSFGTGVAESALSVGFGHMITVPGMSSSFRHTGVDYALDKGTDVKAVNAGEVVYSGYLDYAGNVVCIEHGYGLKSWYAHLGSADVNVGDKVSKGDKIGTTGGSGLTGTDGVHIGLSVYDVPVCQYPLWDSGTWKQIPMYSFK